MRQAMHFNSHRASNIARQCVGFREFKQFNEHKNSSLALGIAGKDCRITYFVITE